MNCSYSLSERDVVKAMQLHGKGSRITLRALVLVGFFLAVAGVLTEHKTLSFAVLIGGIVGYYSVLFLLIPFNAKKQFKQNRAVRNEISLEMTGRGIIFRSESGESRLEWCDIHKWKCGRGVYLLYITSNMFHMIPAKALPNEQVFSVALTENAGPAKV